MEVKQKLVGKRGPPKHAMHMVANPGFWANFRDTKGTPLKRALLRPNLMPAKPEVFFSTWGAESGGGGGGGGTSPWMLPPNT